MGKKLQGGEPHPFLTLPNTPLTPVSPSFTQSWRVNGVPSLLGARGTFLNAVKKEEGVDDGRALELWEAFLQHVRDSLRARAPCFAFPILGLERHPDATPPPRLSFSQRLKAEVRPSLLIARFSK